jgi:hypothetical protein
VGLLGLGNSPLPTTFYLQYSANSLLLHQEGFSIINIVIIYAMVDLDGGPKSNSTSSLEMIVLERWNATAKWEKMTSQ